MPQANSASRVSKGPITYPLERDGQVESVEIPVVIGVLADWARSRHEQSTPLRERRFVTIENASFDDFLR